MKKLHFTCTLLTDIVMSAQAATEGYAPSLDYLPGAKFWGIAAKKLYDMNKAEQTLDIFHRGKVRFGDAHPLLEINGLPMITYRKPINWFKPKGAEDFNIHLQSLYSMNDFDIAYEPMLPFYFSPFKNENQNVHGWKISQRFSIKSAYDQKQYRAEQGKMYGYFALPRHSEWFFSVSFDFDALSYEAQIVDILTGKHRIGRSGSAEYGFIDVKPTTIVPAAIPQKLQPDDVQWLYAASDWCFYDRYLRPTLQIDPERHLALSEPSQGSIDWNRSFIISRRYSPWNGQRRNRDGERIVIEKGSLLAVKCDYPLDSARFDQGIGSHRSEGLGEVLLNPDFIFNPPSKIQRGTPLLVPAIHSLLPNNEESKDRQLLEALCARAIRSDADFRITRQVETFVNTHGSKFDELSPSQWGQIRTIAKGIMGDASMLYELLFNSEFGFCRSGQSAKAWEINQRHELLRNLLFGSETESPASHSEVILLTIKLANVMTKYANSKKP